MLVILPPKYVRCLRCGRITKASTLTWSRLCSQCGSDDWVASEPPDRLGPLLDAVRKREER